METKLRSSNNISSPTFVHKVLFVPAQLGWPTKKKFKKGQMVLNYNLFSLRIKNLQDFVVVWSKGERIISGIFIFLFFNMCKFNKSLLLSYLFCIRIFRSLCNHVLDLFGLFSKIFQRFEHKLYVKLLLISLISGINLKLALLPTFASKNLAFYIYIFL